MTLTRGPARCGTPSGYNAHQKRRERPCNACFKAKAEYDARRRNATDDNVRMTRIRAAAQSRAYKWLSANHYEEYRTLYAAALQEILAERGDNAS